MDKAQKKETVAALKETFSAATSVVILHYRGLSVSEITDLRSKARSNGVSLKVTKNKLTKLAVDGTQYKELSELFSGPTAIAYSNDEVAAAKTIVEFAKDNEKVEILGGAIGEKRLAQDEIRSLATLPSLDGSRAKLVALINTPATRIVGVLQASGGQLARVISAKASAEA